MIINIANGKQEIKDWPRGTNELGATVPRFHAGIASATVVIAPPKGTVSANPAKIDCNQNTQLAWSSSETVDADMTNMSPVSTHGEKSVSPRQTTEYKLTAIGPGGTTQPTATVEVNPVVQSSLSASPTEIRYRRLGDKVLEQGTTTLQWSTFNSDASAIEPLGTVDSNGSKSLTLTPAQTTNGSVDQEFKYTLRATNVCGGSDSKTVSVRLTGSIEPIPEVFLQSVFFPTDYPTRQHPSLGLVRSQQEVLRAMADGFKQYLEYDPEAKLSLSAYADERGEYEYNQNLSGLRAQRVKDFLIEQGVAADKIDSSAYGSQNPLDKAVVADLQTRNSNQAPETRVANIRATCLAYNRRVDVALLPTNAESVRFYPNKAVDSEVLWQRPKPDRSTVEQSN